MFRKGWSQCSGIGGQFVAEWVVTMRRNTQPLSITGGSSPLVSIYWVTPIGVAHPYFWPWFTMQICLKISPDGPILLLPNGTNLRSHFHSIGRMVHRVPSVLPLFYTLTGEHVRSIKFANRFSPPSRSLWEGLRVCSVWQTIGWTIWFIVISLSVLFMNYLVVGHFSINHNLDIRGF